MKQTPWGNAYCETKGCANDHPGDYSATTRQCWNKKCDPAGSPASDCFSCIPSMTWTCQHGKDECKGNSYMGCAINTTVTKNSWWNFSFCFEGQHEGDLAHAEECAKFAGYDYNKLSSCVTSITGSNIAEMNARHTCTRPHSGTPTIFANGQEIIGHTANDLLDAICSAYTGTKPAGCNKVNKISDEPEGGVDKYYVNLSQ